jgi:hypothetical protein
MLHGWIIGACALLLAAGSAFPQERGRASAEELGVVHFSTSCNAAAQKELDRAVALLHSFQFSRAMQGFDAALDNDSSCGIAYWGIAPPGALSQWSNRCSIRAQIRHG